MPYLVQTLPSVEEYLAAIVDLPRDVILEVLADVEHVLSEKADFYLERFPLGHESYRFEFDTTIIHGDRMITFRFVVDAANREAGVVRIVYADHEIIP